MINRVLRNGLKEACGGWKSAILMVVTKQSITKRRNCMNDWLLNCNNFNTLVSVINILLFHNKLLDREADWVESAAVVSSWRCDGASSWFSWCHQERARVNNYTRFRHRKSSSKGIKIFLLPRGRSFWRWKSTMSQTPNEVARVQGVAPCAMTDTALHSWNFV